jgi:hypothetical protein
MSHQQLQQIKVALLYISLTLLKMAIDLSNTGSELSCSCPPETSVSYPNKVWLLFLYPSSAVVWQKKKEVKRGPHILWKLVKIVVGQNSSDEMPKEP